MAFVALDYHVNYGQLVDLASGFASTQIFLAGLTLLCIYLLVRKKPQSKWRALGWLVLSCFFIYMAIAGNVLLHERPGAASRAMGRLVFLPAYLGLGLLTLGFLWREMATTSSRLLLLFAIPCFALAVGIDYAEGLNPDHPWNPYTFLAGRTNLNIWVVAGQLSKSIEESLEMLGYSILWFLFIGHLGTITNDLQVQFRS